MFTVPPPPSPRLVYGEEQSHASDSIIDAQVQASSKLHTSGLPFVRNIPLYMYTDLGCGRGGRVPMRVACKFAPILMLTRGVLRIEIFETELNTDRLV